MEFDEELLPFEAQFSYPRPRKGIDFVHTLEDKQAGVRNSQIQWHSIRALEEKEKAMFKTKEEAPCERVQRVRW